MCWLLFGVRSTPVLRQWHVKDPGHSAKSAGGRLHLKTRIHLWPNEIGVGWLCRCPGIVWGPIRKRAHTQAVREHSDTVVSARLATVDWSLPKEWNWCARANLHLKKKKKCRQEMNYRTFSQNPLTQGKGHQSRWCRSADKREEEVAAVAVIVNVLTLRLAFLKEECMLAMLQTDMRLLPVYTSGASSIESDTTARPPNMWQLTSVFSLRVSIPCVWCGGFVNSHSQS